jgi:hypothetical protein
MTKPTEEDLAGLSEQEKAALLEDYDESTPGEEGEDEPDEAAQAAAAEAAAKSAEKPAEGAEKGEQAKPGEEKPAEEEEPPAAEGPKEIAPVGSRKVADTVVPNGDDKAAQTLTDLDKQLDALDVKLADGEIDAAEYTAQTRRINDQRIDIKALQAAEKARIQTIRETSARAWQDEQDHFFRRPENAIFDQEKNPVLFDALDAQIRRITAKPENAGMLLRDVLATARADVLKAFGQAEPAAKEKPENDKGKVSDQQKPAKNPTKQPDLPQTLGGVPAAADNGTGGEFDHLDNLAGMDLDRAIAKLSPEQQERYLRGG